MGDLEMMTVVVPEMMIDVDQEMMTDAVQEMTTVVDLEMMIADLLVTRDPWTGAVDLEDPLEMTTAVDLEKMTVEDLEMMTVVDPVIDQPEIKMTAGRRSTSVKPSSLTSRVLCVRAQQARAHFSDGAWPAHCVTCPLPT